MSLKTAFLATVAAGAFLLVAACGGGDSSNTYLPSNSASISCTPGVGNCIAWGVVPTTVRYVAIDLFSDGHGSMSGWGIGDGEQVGDYVVACTGRPRICGQLGTERALLWSGSASSLVNLHPDGFTASSGSATSGGVQIGFGRIAGHTHALKWAGSASSVMDLHPTGFDSSEAVGISGDQVAGFGRIADAPHALLWTSGGVVDLHPRGFSGSRALATDGSKQVGEGDGHALLWTGSANSFVDLHPYYVRSFVPSSSIQYTDPCPLSSSIAQGVSGDQQVGSGKTACGWETRHALLWQGTAGSVVDLHPYGFWESVATAVANGRQVGWGSIVNPTNVHALLWTGTADSAVDLHMFLPREFVHSQANGIDASGNIIGTADGHPILWVRQ